MVHRLLTTALNALTHTQGSTSRIVRSVATVGRMAVAGTLVASLFSTPAIAVDANSKWLNPDRAELEAQKDTKMPFYPHRANTTDNKLLKDSDFQPAEICGSCHTEIYKQWRTSIMSQSWEDPIYRGLLKMASEATDGAVDNFCTGCHTPIGLTTGKINSETNRSSVEHTAEHNPMPGVDCESCHNMTSRTGLDNGAYVLTPNVGGKPTKFGPRKDAVSPFHETEYSEFHTRSDFCATCHNVTHPFTSVPIERTYDEWLESPYAYNDQQCQDCHMAPFKGKAAIIGPEREDVASHWFTGGNVTVMKHFGEEEAAERARDLLRSAAEMKFLEFPEEIVAGQRVNFKVKVKNTGTGHKLPTGFPEGREVWIDFKVTDSTGKEVYRLGAVKEGKTEPGTKNFKVHLGDKDGNEVDLEVWTVTQILSDNRLLPKGYDIAEFSFDLPADVKGPLTVSADLNYWPFPQAIVDILVGPGKLPVEITNMVSIEKKVDTTTVTASK